MNRKKIIIILIIIIIVLLLAFLFWFFFFKSAPLADNGNQNDNSAGQTPTETTTALPAPSPSRINDEKSYPLGLKQLAISYSERFASYSSDANFKNLTDLEIFSTARMKLFMADFKRNNISGSNGYEAVEAKALNSQISSADNSKATVVVALQLTKFSGDKSNPATSYGYLQLKFVKAGEQWLVDEANWQ